MPKYYCDYCDTHLTHDSPSVRKTHSEGRKHRDNVRIYYQKWVEEEAQHLIDVTTAAYKSKNKLNLRNGFIGEPNMNVMHIPPPGFGANIGQQLGSMQSNGIPTTGLPGPSNALPTVFNFPTCLPPPNMLNNQVNGVFGLPNGLPSSMVPMMVPPPSFDASGRYNFPNPPPL